MSKNKKLIRYLFREKVFVRDDFKCKMCGIKPESLQLDPHHITDRNEMPNGGYVAENGIALCPECHKKAEQFHETGEAVEGYSPEDLYNAIGSNKEKAVKASEKLDK